MSKLRITLSIAAAVVAVAGSITAWKIHAIHRSPLYSLRQLVNAAEARDRLGVEQYLDAHRVAESVIDQAIAAATVQAANEPSDNPWRALGSTLGIQMMQGMKSSLVTLLEQALWAALSDSASSSRQLDGRLRAVVGGPLNADSLRQRYLGVIGVEERGNLARVGVRVRSEGPDSALPLYLRLERADAHWRLVGVEGLLQPAIAASNKDALERAHIASMKSDLRNLVTAEEAYFADSVKYGTAVSCANPPKGGAVAFCTTTGNALSRIMVGRGTQAGWTASIMNASTPTLCAIYVGAVSPAAPATTSDPEGAPVCRLARAASSDSSSSSSKSTVPRPPAQRPRAVVPKSAAPPHASANFEIVNVETKVTEQNDVYWRYAWRLTLKSMSTDALVLSATIEFQDSDGFVIDTDQAYNLYLSPGEEKTFTGYALVTATTAANVAKTNAKVRSNF